MFAEDVLQEVFVRLWERPDTYDADRGSLRSYLLTMTHSRAVERLRAEASQRRRRAAAEREPAYTIAPDPGDDLALRTTGAAVRHALAGLPAEQREPIEMAYFGGMSYREVAVALDEPEGTIRYRIRAGMQKMRAALQREEVWPRE
jgi:RNA polymerase sigma-70 factor (ECF subfamily)